MRAEEALAIPLAASRRSFGLSLITEVVEQTAGYPYFLQFFAAFACSRIGLEHIELADYQRVESALLHELDLAFFEDRFEGAAPSEQALLLAMARAGGRVGLARLGSEIPPGLNVPVGLRRLIDRGLVYRPTRATYRLRVAALRDVSAAAAETNKVIVEAIISMQPVPLAAPQPFDPPLGELIADYEQSLRADRHSVRTIDWYLAFLRESCSFAERPSESASLRHLSTPVVRRWLVALESRPNTPSTVQPRRPSPYPARVRRVGAARVRPRAASSEEAQDTASAAHAHSLPAWR